MNAVYDRLPSDVMGVQMVVSLAAPTLCFLDANPT